MRSKTVRVWCDDDELIVELAKRGPKLDYRSVWVEFTISRPQVGSQGMETDPVVEGFVTATRKEFQTLGAYDGNHYHLFSALTRAYAEARTLLEAEE